jgi:heat shock protein HtpX
MNRLKTTLFLGLLTGLVMAVGYMLGGQAGLVFALIFSAALNFGAYWWSDKIVLAAYGAKKVKKEDFPELFRLLEGLTARASMPMPAVSVIDMEMPNAFATGRNENHAVVAVTTGLMKILNREELEGVLAHELSHIKNKDMLISSIAATIAGAISYLVQIAYFASIFGGSGDDEDGGGILGMLAMLILAPIISVMLHMAVSRSREYLADAGGAKITGNPRGLASALKKLGDFTSRHKIHGTPRQETAAHLFIVNPFKASALMSLFSTHPPMDKRIGRLEKIV